MNAEEYGQKMKSIEKKFETAKRDLAYACAMSNDTCAIGEIIVDRHGSKIRIGRTKWTYGFGEKLPSCVYVGVKLKKDNTTFKSGETGTINQSDIVEATQ